MKHENDKWIAAYKQAVKDLPHCGVSDGMVCAVATLRVVRDGLIAEVATAGGEASKDAKAEAGELAGEIKAAFGEMIQQITAGKGVKLQGFASNASAASKAAGLDAVKEVATLIGLAE